MEWETSRSRLRGLAYFFFFMELYDVADLYIIKPCQCGTAFHSRIHFPDIILEALEAAYLCINNNFAVADDPRHGVTADLAVLDNHACYLSLIGYRENSPDLCLSFHHILVGWLKHALECLIHISDEVVDHAVKADTNFFQLCQTLRTRFRPAIKAHN